MTTIKFKKTDPDAVIPYYASQGAACFDLVTTHGGEVPANDSAVFNIGLSVEFERGYVMLIYSRSGHGFKNGLRLSNAVGVIDSDYRGTIAVKIQNDTPVSFSFGRGDRVAQAMLIKLPEVNIVEVDRLSATERGAGGFGSTG